MRLFMLGGVFGMIVFWSLYYITKRKHHKDIAPLQGKIAVISIFASAFAILLIFIIIIYAELGSHLEIRLLHAITSRAASELILGVVIASTISVALLPSHGDLRGLIGRIGFGGSIILFVVVFGIWQPQILSNLRVSSIGAGDFRINFEVVREPFARQTSFDFLSAELLNYNNIRSGAAYVGNITSRFGAATLIFPEVRQRPTGREAIITLSHNITGRDRVMVELTERFDTTGQTRLPPALQRWVLNPEDLGKNEVQSVMHGFLSCVLLAVHLDTHFFQRSNLHFHRALRSLGFFVETAWHFLQQQQSSRLPEMDQRNIEILNDMMQHFWRLVNDFAQNLGQQGIVFSQRQVEIFGEAALRDEEMHPKTIIVRPAEFLKTLRKITAYII